MLDLYANGTTMRPSGLTYGFLTAILLTACIGTDYIMDLIDPELRFTIKLDVLGIGDSYQFRAVFFDNVGDAQTVPLEWMSSDTAVAEVTQDGTVTGKMLGNTVISARYSGEDTMLTVSHMLEVDEETVLPVSERSGTVETTSSYELFGDFTLTEEENGTLTLAFAENYTASTALPGLFVYLSNNPSTTNGAYEIGEVLVFSGAHSYSLPATIGLNDYQYVLYFCKPFNVKVGDGRIN